ncbi:MAG: helix-turn-helix domain-containing protein [Lachnospiraceae bacterium]|nr:helix-turn-helix domain-containing protein [Lachnospiraceae bacterium]
MEEYVITSKQLDQVLEEMTGISKRDFLLFSVDGEQVAGSAQEGFAEQIRQFADSPAETQVMEEWIYFRVEMHEETEYVLLCSSNGETDQSYVIGRMALCNVRNLLLSQQEPETRTSGLRQILTGEIPASKVAEKCHQLRLKPNNYILYVIQYKNNEDSILIEMLKNLFANSPLDYVIEMDGSRAVLIKDTASLTDLDFEQYAQMIVDNLQTEAMTNVWVGYGDPVDSFEQMGTAYSDACTALKIGTVFYAEERVYYYQRLGIGRLIYKLPADQCEMFLQEVLGENMEIDLDEETMNTIKKLFDNNLNISETARQLYIHRNTLVYRLERIEKKLGLDIRSFDDAMMFRIAMMVRIHLNELNVVK